MDDHIILISKKIIVEMCKALFEGGQGIMLNCVKYCLSEVLCLTLLSVLVKLCKALFEQGIMFNVVKLCKALFERGIMFNVVKLCKALFEGERGSYV